MYRPFNKHRIRNVPSSTPNFFFIVFKILFNSAYCRGHIKTINEITKKLISKVKRIRRQWRKIAYSNAVLIKRLIENFDGDLPR